MYTYKYVSKYLVLIVDIAFVQVNIRFIYLHISMSALILHVEHMVFNFLKIKSIKKKLKLN